MGRVVAIVGRPNVGKSTLFNRLIGERKSIVNDRPGVTRDRIYGEGLVNGEPVTFIDTGGFEPRPDHSIFEQIREQAKLAIAQADLLLFVVDRASGLTATDEQTAKVLRKLLPKGEEDRLVVVVNKCDTPQHEADAVDFWSLGFQNLLCVSAEHGQGMFELWDYIYCRLPPYIHPSEDDFNDQPDVDSSAMVDKSEDQIDDQQASALTKKELVEACDEDVSYKAEEDEAEAFASEAGDSDMSSEPVDEYTMWKQWVESLEHGSQQEDSQQEDSQQQDSEQEDNDATVFDDKQAPRDEELRIAVLGRPNIGKSTLVNRLIGEERHVVHDMPGTTMDAVDSTIELNGQKYRFVDTAGIRRKSKIDDRLESFAVFRAIRTIERCHVVLLMIDGVEGVTNQDAKLAALIADRGRACVILVNRWDLVRQHPERNVHVLRDELDRGFPHLSWAPELYISALTGKGCHKILEEVHRVYEMFNHRIPTAQLNKFLSEIVEYHPPPQRHHHRVRLNYITQPRVRPPTFVIWANSPDGIKTPYRRYLENQLRDRFSLDGTPIRLFIRQKRRQWEDRD